MKARTIPWESIADWYKENEQVIRDVMKFEGLRGAVNEVLRLAPDQPELAALREELDKANKSADTYLAAWEKCAEFRDASEAKLTAAEQRNAELFDRAKELTIWMHAEWGNTEIHPDCIRDLAFLNPKPTESGASE